MKLDNKQKIVLFYGNILRVNSNTEYLAANDAGKVFAYTGRPKLMKYEGTWDCPYGYSSKLIATLEKVENWVDTLTYCKGEGQEWMLDLKTSIVVKCSLLEAGAILLQDALINVIESFPLGEQFLSQHWDAFQKHSGVKDIANEKFLDILSSRVKAAPKLSIWVEKSANTEDDSLLVRDYFGGELVLPEWVKFIAINSDGKVSGFEEHPEVDVQSGVWIK